MSRESDSREKSLKESLARVNEALERTNQAAPTKRGAPVTPSQGTTTAAIGTGAFATTFIVLAIVLGNWWLLLPAFVFGIAASVLLVQRRLSEAFSQFERDLPQGEGRKGPHIGMGATVASDAVLEPGAVVEMGATVGSGATIRAGAVVRMGATVMSNAVIESGAVVSWGATVHKGAVVGSNATVGAGSDIMAGAHVPPNTSLMPGTTYRAPASGTPALASPAAKPQAEKPQATKPVDPRESRIDTICDRLETELRDAPESVRTFLGTSTDTIAALRRTCHDLLRRERALRDESSAEALARLDSEKSVLESRIASTTDEVIRRSLQGAVAAIAEQKRQRETLQRNADRLDAEFTRLAYMLEGMAAQLVRLRSAAPQPGAATDPELEKSLTQLHHEIEAIADALEHVSSGADDSLSAPLPSPISEISSDSSEEELARANRPRQRDR
jgi:carbonic anhydrase/acetyltransferase-like protein (isoleucine patch superfamily)